MKQFSKTVLAIGVLLMGAHLWGENKGVAQTCTGIDTLTAFAGSFSDGSGVGNYSDNLDCKWLIQPSGVTFITLTFTSFDTEAGWDLVTVYDGATTGDSILGTFSGNTIPPSVTSTGGIMLVHFTADPGTNDLGWDAIYVTNITVPLVDFSASTNVTGIGGNVDFTDNSVGSPTTWTWTFQGGTPATSTAQNPTGIIYNNSGCFDVSLIAANGNGSDTLIQSCYITVTSLNFCSGPDTLTAYNASFNDGSDTSNYVNNLNCSWLIKPVNTNDLALFFPIFDIAAGDQLTIYDGENDTATVLDVLTGYVWPPQTYYASGGALYLEFQTNNVNTGPGWYGQYSSTVTPTVDTSCSGLTVLTDSAGLFTDGSDEGIVYGTNADCQWLIQPPGVANIVLWFNWFYIEGGSDFLFIYDGADTTAPLLGAYSGSFTPPPVLVSSGGSLFLRFITDSYAGFDDGWEAQYGDPPCFGTDTLTAFPGAFSDGSGVGNYRSEVNCKWVIQPPGVDSITLSFTSFALEDGFDFVNIYDGDNTGAPLLGSFTGLNIPPCITSSGGSMLVEIISDESVNEDGFSATYGAYCVDVGMDTLSGFSGIVSDGSDTNDYASSTNLFWLIQPPGVDSIVFTFTEIDVEDGYDYVTIYDGSSFNDAVLGIFTGSTLPGEIVSTGGTMLIRFQSDAIESGPGWEGYYCTSPAYPNLVVSSDTSICVGASVQLTSSGGVNYAWYPSVGLNDSSIAGPIATPSYSATYVVTVSDSVGCSVIDSVSILLEPYPLPICLVTVDSATQKNAVVWEKSTEYNVMSYYIYKESAQIGSYSIAGIVPYNDLGIFIDSLSDPIQKSARYKIAAVDSCGQISVISEPHKTMHLSINLGINNWINLIWDHYEGFDFGTYYIHRYSTLNGWEVIDSLASNLTSSTDFSPPTGGLFYQVEARYAIGCTASKTKNFNSAKSNTSSFSGSSTALSVSSTATDASQGNCNGSAIAIVSGGASPYTYLWDDSLSQATQMAAGLCPGTYTVLVTDFQGDSATSTVTIMNIQTGMADLDLINSINIYPNPNTGEFTLAINLPEARNLEIIITNILGQSVYTKSVDNIVGEFKHQVDLSNHSPGLYSLQLISSDGITNMTLVIK